MVDVQRSMFHVRFDCVRQTGNAGEDSLRRVRQIVCVQDEIELENSIAPLLGAFL